MTLWNTFWSVSRQQSTYHSISLILIFFPRIWLHTFSCSVWIHSIFYNLSTIIRRSLIVHSFAQCFSPWFHPPQSICISAVKTVIFCCIYKGDFPGGLPCIVKSCWLKRFHIYLLSVQWLGEKVAFILFFFCHGKQDYLSFYIRSSSIQVGAFKNFYKWS